MSSSENTSEIIFSFLYFLGIEKENRFKAAISKMNAYDQLSSLDGSRTNWRVKVRVTRMWPSISKSGEKENFRGYNLLLLDEENCHVHAFVYADNWTTLTKKVKIEEGSIYVISNFYTRDAFGKLRPVSTKKIINFSNSTDVLKIDDDDMMIPMHKFELVCLGELYDLAKSCPEPNTPDHSTDVIGVVENYEDLQEINTVNGPRKVVRFRITDGRNSSTVAVWGDLAERAQKEKIKAVEKPRIVILTSTRPKVYKSMVQINTLTSSKIYMNLDIDSVIAMRQRLIEEGYTKSEEENNTPPPQELQQKIETMTLNELSDNITAEYIKKNVYCVVRVVNVEENSWWYDSCGCCETEVEKKDGKVYCSNCKHCIPVAEKRYQVVVLAEDNTEAYNFVLMDRGVKRMVGTTATKKISEKMKNQTCNIFPPEIKAITGKELRLKLLIKEENVKAKSKLYFAIDATDSSATTSTSGSVSGLAATVSTVGETSSVQLSDDNGTPGTAKSSSKRMKKDDSA